MNRERWTSFPASTEEERALVAALGGTRARRELRLATAGGSGRFAGATLSLEAAEPFDGKADVVARLDFEDGDAPRAGELLVDDPWALLDAFLRDAEARARAGQRR